MVLLGYAWLAKLHSSQETQRMLATFVGSDAVSIYVDSEFHFNCALFGLVTSEYCPLKEAIPVTPERDARMYV